MKYEGKSDFEVNQSVALKIRGSDEVSIIQHLGLVNIFCGNPKDEDNSSWRSFDPCNNPSDAWPIIIDNKIDICHAIDGGVSCGVFEKTIYGDFQSQHLTECDSEQEVLYTAMICFLKMKDAESE